MKHFISWLVALPTVVPLIMMCLWHVDAVSWSIAYTNDSIATVYFEWPRAQMLARSKVALQHSLTACERFCARCCQNCLSVSRRFRIVCPRYVTFNCATTTLVGLHANTHHQRYHTPQNYVHLPSKLADVWFYLLCCPSIPFWLKDFAASFCFFTTYLKDEARN